MSRRNAAPSLHIEWTPTQVRAVDIASNRSGSAHNLTELRSLLEGHREALVGVGRSLVFLKALRLPKAAPEDLRRILGIQIGQFFPLPPDQLAWDFIQTNDNAGDGYLTVLAAMRTEDLRRLRDDLKQAGLTASRILPVSLGAPAVAAGIGEGLPDALVAERSGGVLSLDVVQGGIIRFSRVTLADTDPQSEAKRTMAAAGIDDLPLVAIGDGLRLPGALTVPDGSTTLSQLDEAPPFAFELADERAREIARRQSAHMKLAALMTAAAVLLAVLVWANRSDAEKVLKRGEGAWSSQLGKLRSIRTHETEKAQAASVVNTGLTRAFDPAQPLSDVMSVVGDSLPSGAWLTGISFERGKPLQIRGTAKTSDDVAHFVAKLGSNSRLRDVRLAFANSAKIDATQVVQFNITAVAVGNLPMPEPPKTKGKGAKPATPKPTTGSDASAANGTPTTGNATT